MAIENTLKGFRAVGWTAPSEVLRAWAGAHTCLGHGVLRWSDLQHSRDITFSKDAVLGVTWRMQRRQVQVPWAALRVGWSGQVVGNEWLHVLGWNNMPGEDFVMLAQMADCSSLRPTIANVDHAQAAMRALLLLLVFDDSEAMFFSCHSWRHFHPSAARQLQMGAVGCNDMGHWAHNSGMPQW